MKKRQWVVVGATLAVGLGVILVVPLLARQIDFFRVRQIELVGVRYLAPDSVIAALGLRLDHNAFDDLSVLEGRVGAIVGVESARVDRRMPGTIRVTLRERTPVALAPGPERLVVLDGDARLLPYDPAATGLDLPLVPRADTVLLQVLAAVRSSDSTLFDEVDGAQRSDRGDVWLDVRGRRVVLDGVPTGPEVRAVGAVRRHLARTGRRYAELDARFAGWLVVRRSRT